MQAKWERRGLVERVGNRSFVIAGSEPTWMRSLTAAVLDLGGVGVVAGRSAARLHGLDGFQEGEPELLVERRHRDRASSGIVRSTGQRIPRSDVQRLKGLPVLRAERTIIACPVFGFTRSGVENAIDSAVRLRLVSEQRLRTRVVREHSSGVNGSRLLLDAMLDTGGESCLERWFLALCRQHGLPRPILRKTYRDGGRVVARVDAEFPGGLVVELAGHGTHSSRRQRQLDAQRATELTLLGKRVITFTYEDVRDRPAWVAGCVARAIAIGRTA